MKTSLLQYNIFFENFQANIKKATALIRTAAESSKLILLPEMSFTGFSMRPELTGTFCEETFQHMQALASELKVFLGFGYTRLLPDGKGENHYAILSEKGILQDYVKIHPFSCSGEDRVFARGTSASACNMEGLNIGIQICYDLRFGNTFSALAGKCDVVIVPANWPNARSEHWKTLLRARAIENQCYILGINCVSTGDYRTENNGLFYSGDSMAINPNGDILSALSEKEGILTVDIPADTEKYRQAFPVLRDWRTIPEP